MGERFILYMQFYKDPDGQSERVCCCGRKGRVVDSLVSDGPQRFYSRCYRCNVGLNGSSLANPANREGILAYHKKYPPPVLQPIVLISKPYVDDFVFGKGELLQEESELIRFRCPYCRGDSNGLEIYPAVLSDIKKGLLFPCVFCERKINLTAKEIERDYYLIVE